jgi:hypothetical protein
MLAAENGNGISYLSKVASNGVQSGQVNKQILDSETHRLCVATTFLNFCA